VDRAVPSVPWLAPPARALLLGAVTGIRSQVPVVLLAIEAQRGDFDPGVGRMARRLGSPGGVVGAALAAAGELVADKLSVTPSRLEPGPFVGRLVAGGVVGAAVHYDAGRSRALGALLGAAGAGVGAAAATRARAAAAGAGRLPEPLLGAAEDLVAVGLGLVVVGAGRRGRS
jgi:uncharacterized membrane protein